MLTTKPMLCSRVGANTAQQSEMLRTAQKICQEAEERADAATKCAPQVTRVLVWLQHLLSQSRHVRGSSCARDSKPQPNGPSQQSPFGKEHCMRLIDIVPTLMCTSGQVRCIAKTRCPCTDGSVVAATARTADSKEAQERRQSSCAATAGG